MDKSDKRVFGIVTVAIVATMVTALVFLRAQAIGVHQTLAPPGIDGDHASWANEQAKRGTP